jgi:hypothetical protein
MKPPEPCKSGRCRSPVACNGFGYCRERNANGLPAAETIAAWREEAKANSVEIIDRKSIKLGGFTLTTTFGRIGPKRP